MLSADLKQGLLPGCNRAAECFAATTADASLQHVNFFPGHSIHIYSETRGTMSNRIVPYLFTVSPHFIGMQPGECVRVRVRAWCVSIHGAII